MTDRSRFVGLAWVPLTHTPRRPLVTCATCPRAEPNEARRLRGWQQARGYPDLYRCPTCTEDPHA